MEGRSEYGCCINVYSIVLTGLWMNRGYDTFLVLFDHLYTVNSSAQEYEGQVNLCPPDGFPLGKQSVSTGLVQIHLYREKKGINQNTSQRLKTHVADSICRQLGYTNAVTNSPATAKTTNQNFSNCYVGDE